DGRPVGAISLVYGSSGRTYDVEDRRMVEELARRASTALHNARVVAQLRIARAQLEEKARKMELQSRDLEDALTRLKLAAEQTPLSMLDVDPLGRVVAWNPGA